MTAQMTILGVARGGQRNKMTARQRRAVFGRVNPARWKEGYGGISPDFDDMENAIELFTRVIQKTGALEAGIGYDNIQGPGSKDIHLVRIEEGPKFRRTVRWVFNVRLPIYRPWPYD